MRFLFISNMFPTNKDVTFGTFAKSSLDDLCGYFNLARSIVITIRGRSLRKLFEYNLALLKILFFSAKGGFDFIYAHYLTHTTFGLLPFIRIRHCVINVHGFDFMPVTAYQKILSLPNGYMLKHAKLVVVPSPYARDELLSRHRKLNSKKIVVNYSGGVDRSVFKKANVKKSFDFIYISRIDPDKGWPLLIRAVRSIAIINPNVSVAICGAGSQRHQLVDMIQEYNLGECIKYIGPVAPDEVPVWLNKSRYFVFPTMMESLGLVALEALTCGVPVITYNARPMADYIVNRRSGLLFDEFSAESLLESMLVALRLTEVAYNNMSICAINDSALYDRDLLAASLAARIREIIV